MPDRLDSAPLALGLVIVTALTQLSLVIWPPDPPIIRDVKHIFPVKEE